MTKHFIDISVVSAKDLNYIVDLGLKIKKNPELYYDKLKHKNMILLLEKNSTRTRVSFEFAMKELGGDVCILNSNSTQISRGESIEDTAKVFDRYADCIVFRTSAHDRILQMSDNCSKSAVVNALTDESHPCQIMADIMTIIEQFGSISGKKIAWIGDVNNVLKSWIAAAGKFDFTINVCCPLELSAKIPNSLKASFIQDKFKAVEKCDVVTTDTWVSMGEDKAKIKIFDNFTVDKNLMNFAKKDAIFLHCLPAYREYEVSSDVLDDEKYSKIVFNEAENRLHIQKAILMWCLNII